MEILSDRRQIIILSENKALVITLISTLKGDRFFVYLVSVDSLAISGCKTAIHYGNPKRKQLSAIPFSPIEN
ncbi:hypothetical protein [Anabaena azotica]|uniref:Uncharacterized protein n=1 Tax=Anabaena azotica FACHB-119 TaxID=947527 RepID=A0ABR8DGJ5_9NOST|nr:hypothetical protein [Anabaena azotica]MBD2505312.1 hypothetical protein [Anabaena azotica FACHB-119]